MTPFSMFLALQPELRETWSLSNTASGWISSAYYAGDMVAVPLLAGLTDRVDTRSVWLAATALSGAAAGGFALAAQGVWTALLFQFLAGAGLAGTYMPGLKLIADRIEGVPHPRHVAFYTTSFTIGSSVSFFLIGALHETLPWRVAIAAAAAGPAAAWSLVFALLERSPARGVHESAHWRRVLQSAPAMRYVAGYAAHMWELFAVRAWLVPFLTFCALQRTDPPILGAPALAAIISLVGVPSSLAGAELSARFRRGIVIRASMLLSFAAAVICGMTAGMPWAVLLLVACVYSALISADSATLTSGLVAVAPPGSRGTAMAVYSMVGFASASAGAFAIGGLLDALGGETARNWIIAFAAMGASNLIGVAALRTTPDA